VHSHSHSHSRSPLALALALALAPSPARAQTVELELTHGAYVRDDAPEAIAHIPAGLDTTHPVALVVFLHGYSGCTRVLVSDAPDARCRPRDAPEAGYALAREHDAAGTRSILLVPQLAFRVRDGDPGRFRIAGEAARMIDESLAQIAPTLDHSSVASITLVAHSAAFETTLAILRHGGLDARLRHVVLFDALYSGGPTFLDWIAAASDTTPRTLISLTTNGRPLDRTRELLRTARHRWPDATLEPEEWPAVLPAPHPRLIVGSRVHVPHHDVPTRFLAATLRALGLPAR
jgi:hypothetical protein